jgi:hypothetical protein
MKFGGEVTWIQTNNVNSRNKGGSFSFTGRYSRNPLTATGGSSVADFLLGAVDNSNFSTATRIEGRTTMWAGYFQDDWKVARRLTLNLGVRYEYMRPFHDKYNKLANVDLDTDPYRPTLVLASEVGPASFLSSDFNNIQPRIGLAYQLTPEKTVLRAGYGIYFPMSRFSPFGDSSSILVNPPYNVAVTTSSDGITPASYLRNGIPADQLALQNAQSVSLASLERQPALGYSQQWNLNIQHQVARDWMVQVGYFGNKGNHLSNLIDTNYVESLGPGNINQRRRFKSLFVPTTVPGQAGLVSGVVVSPLGQILRQEYTGNTIFHSLQAKVEHRFSSGFTVLSSWIWSKGLGDIRGSNPSGAAPGSNYQNPANLRAERGLLDTHVAHSFVLSTIWDLPFGRGRRFGAHLPSVAEAILGGWSMGGILTMTSGRPFNVTVNGDPSNSGQVNRADLVGDPNEVPGGRSVRQFFNTAALQANKPFQYGNLGRNALIGPSFANVDASMMKEAALFRVAEQPFQLQFRWEFFNIFNHPNFGFPGATVGNPTFGQLTNASPGRKMQVGLKLIF